MIDERIQSLIHQDVDGELDAGAREELQRVLEHSPEARAYRADVQALSEFLRRVPEHEPPAGMRPGIVGAVRLPRRAGSMRGSGFTRLPGFLRYGFAGAAGLVLAMAIYENRDQWDDPAEVSNMVGTVSSPAIRQGGEVFDRFEWSGADASATVRLLQRDEVKVLEVELTSAEPIGFRIDLSGSGYLVGALADPVSDLSYRAGAGRVEVNGKASGRERMVVVLAAGGTPPQPGPAAIDVRFYSSSGQEIGLGSLTFAD